MSDIDTLTDMFVDAMFIHGQGSGTPIGVLSTTDMAEPDGTGIKGHPSLIGLNTTQSRNNITRMIVAQARNIAKGVGGVESPEGKGGLTGWGGRSHWKQI